MWRREARRETACDRSDVFLKKTRPVFGSKLRPFKQQCFLKSILFNFVRFYFSICGGSTARFFICCRANHSTFFSRVSGAIIQMSIFLQGQPLDYSLSFFFQGQPRDYSKLSLFFSSVNRWINTCSFFFPGSTARLLNICFSSVKYSSIFSRVSRASIQNSIVCMVNHSIIILLFSSIYLY